VVEQVSRRRSSEQVRTLLIEAAAARFAQHDYDRTTVKDITDAVNVSVSVFYRHFQDKADIYEAAVLSPLLSFLTDFVPSWQAHRDEPFDDTAQMHALLRDLYDNISRHRDALRAFVGRSGELEQQLTDRLNLAVGRIFHQIILMGAEESDRRMWRLTAVEVDQTIRLLVSMVLGTVMFEPWILPDPRPAARNQLIDRMVDLALHGTTARQPLQGGSLTEHRAARTFGD
jgi:AcrR family transcriptional regulator